MSKIIRIVKSMSDDYQLHPNDGRLIDHKITIKCNYCLKLYTITVGAVYKQYKRGHTKYICKSCASKQGWSTQNKNKARNKSKENWTNPKYAGTIQGKAIAKEIKRELEL